MNQQKLCECGCGQFTPLCKYTLRKQGYVKGEPLRFIPGHHGRLTTWTDERRKAFKEKRLGHPVTDETRRKMSEYNKAHGVQPSPEATAKGNANRPTGEDSPSWKGGISYMGNYRGIYKPDHPRAYSNGYVYEHILVAEAKLGRPLAPSECVHHIDLDKTNNHPDNIQVFASDSEHARFHNDLKRKV